MAKAIASIGICLILGGCSPFDKDVTIGNNNYYSFANTASGYSLLLPYELHRFGSSFFFSTVTPPQGAEVFIHNDRLTEKDFDLLIYGNSPAPNCEHTGITQPLQRVDAEGTTIMWGKIDEVAYDMSLKPECRIVGIKGPLAPYSSAYGLCSVRGNETVFLCLMQMTDNPQLAEEIFSTFRWE